MGGGGGPDSCDKNIAFAEYSAILGGRNNLAGDGSCPWDGVEGRWICTGGTDHAIGRLATVTAGSNNHAGGTFSSVSGSYDRNTSNQYEWQAGDYRYPGW